MERSKGAGAKWVWRRNGEDHFAQEVVDASRYVNTCDFKYTYT